MTDTKHSIDEALKALLSYSQADEEGVMVCVSRQAIHEVADELTRIRAQNAALVEALAALMPTFDMLAGSGVNVDPEQVEAARAAHAQVESDT